MLEAQLQVIDASIKELEAEVEMYESAARDAKAKLKTYKVLRVKTQQALEKLKPAKLNILSDSESEESQ